MKLQMMLVLMFISVFGMYQVSFACGAGGCDPGAGGVKGQKRDALNSSPKTEVFVSQKKTIQLKISGMTCEGCASSAKTALEKVKYVTKAEINFETKIAKVYVEMGKSVNTNDLIKAVESVGYKAQLFKG